MTSFIHTAKHLPPEIITKKFQERRWEVNKKGDDLCPKCIEAHRQKAAKKRRKPGEVHVTPVIQQLPITASNLQKVIHESGIAGVQVEQLEGKRLKFRVILSHIGELNIGRLHHAEGRLAEVFDADFDSNYLKTELSHVNGGSTVQVSASLHWIVGLNPKIHEPVTPAAEAAE